MKARLPLLILGSLALIWLALSFGKLPPTEALGKLFESGLGSPGAIAGTLREAAPLLMAGVAMMLALQAGLFNIGVEGQFLVGALATAAVALRFPGPLGWLMGCAAGPVAGGLWAWPAAWIKARRNGHEVITTIMLNSIAGLVTTTLVAHQLRDPSQEGSTTAAIARKLPTLFENGDLPIGLNLIAAVVACFVLWHWLGKSVPGLELRAVGANPKAAKYAGVRSAEVTLWTLIGSGAIAGLAGALQVLCVEGRFYAGISPGYGFDALGVALLAGTNPLMLIPSGLLFGALAKGGAAIQIFGVPKGITTVLVGVLIVNAAAIRFQKST